MKKILLKLFIGLIFLFGLYYIGTITLNNNGQFVNYYFYPSNSIEESKSYGIHIENIASNQVSYSDGFQENIKSDIVFWLDESRTKKSFGLLSLVPYDTVNESGKVLRIGYKDSKKWVKLNYDDAIWIVYDDSNTIQSLSHTYGKFYKSGDTAIVKFYDDKEKTKPLGVIKIKID